MATVGFKGLITSLTWHAVWQLTAL